MLGNLKLNGSKVPAIWHGRGGGGPPDQDQLVQWLKGSNRDGTLNDKIGAALPTARVTGRNVLNLSGNDAVYLDYGQGHDLGNNYSFALMFRPFDISSIDGIVCNNLGGNLNQADFFLQCISDDYYSFKVSDGTTTVYEVRTQDGTAVNDDTWHTIICVRTPTKQTIYFDGVQGTEIVNTNPAFHYVLSRLRLGIIIPGYTAGMDVGHFAIYNREITAEEAADGSWYTNTEGAYLISPMEEGEGLPYDVSGNDRSALNNYGVWSNQMDRLTSSTSGTPYINTGIQSAQDIEIEVHGRLTGDLVLNVYLFGSFNGSNGLLLGSNGSNYLNYWGTINNSGQEPDDHDHTFILNSTAMYMDGTAITDNTGNTVTYTGDIYLFAYSNATGVATSPCPYRCKYMKIRKAGVLVFDGVPVDGGMYDRISETLKTNLGGGSLDYKQVEQLPSWNLDEGFYSATDDPPTQPFVPALADTAVTTNTYSTWLIAEAASPELIDPVVNITQQQYQPEAADAHAYLLSLGNYTLTDGGPK